MSETPSPSERARELIAEWDRIGVVPNELTEVVRGLLEQYEALATNKTYIEGRYNSLPDDDPRKLRDKIEALHEALTPFAHELSVGGTIASAIESMEGHDWERLAACYPAKRLES